jgi:hypothetical protein
MNDGYRAKLEEGQRFQDHVMEIFWNELKYPLMNFSSREMQMHAENMQGVEIKFDKKFRSTGNLWIEVAEKSSCANERWVPSGIMKESNDWLFAIGDEDTLFVFARSLLVNFYKGRKYHIHETPTSRGFLLPVDVARRWAAKVIESTRTERTEQEQE